MTVINDEEMMIRKQKAATSINIKKNETSRQRLNTLISLLVDSFVNSYRYNSTFRYRTYVKCVTRYFVFSLGFNYDYQVKKSIKTVGRSMIKEELRKPYDLKLIRDID